MLGGVCVFLALGPVDLRGAFDRLAAMTRLIVQQAWGRPLTYTLSLSRNCLRCTPRPRWPESGERRASALGFYHSRLVFSATAGTSPIDNGIG